MVLYSLPGDRSYQERLYPAPATLRRDVRDNLPSYEAVIEFMTLASLRRDGIKIVEGSFKVSSTNGGGYRISFQPAAGHELAAEQFARMHCASLDEHRGGLALRGVDRCMETPAWNPMHGYGSLWLPSLPLGMPMVNHKSVTLLHYPPLSGYQVADYLENNTLRRWKVLLKQSGVADADLDLFYAIQDVLPIAAPGSGQSEYPNDYMPIALTSLFFDNDDEELLYVRSMLELMLNPPGNAARPYTLPLLVGGSPEYDPQAPGWFRVRYRDSFPLDSHGAPMTGVLQTGFVRIFPQSAKETPFLICNHFAAAGVVSGRERGRLGTCAKLRRFVAEDLVAATFVKLCDGAASAGSRVDPAKELAAACTRWFGSADERENPQPSNREDRKTICAMMKMDNCFDEVNRVPRFTYEQALERCATFDNQNFEPCCEC